MKNPRVQLLLRALDTAYDHSSWHGPIQLLKRLRPAR